MLERLPDCTQKVVSLYRILSASRDTSSVTKTTTIINKLHLLKQSFARWSSRCCHLVPTELIPLHSEGIRVVMLVLALWEDGMACRGSYFNKQHQAAQLIMPTERLYMF